MRTMQFAVCRLQLPWHWRLTAGWQFDKCLTAIQPYRLELSLPQHKSYQSGCFPQRWMKQQMGLRAFSCDMQSGVVLYYNRTFRETARSFIRFRVNVQHYSQNQVQNCILGDRRIHFATITLHTAVAGTCMLSIRSAFLFHRSFTLNQVQW